MFHKIYLVHSRILSQIILEIIHYSVMFLKKTILKILLTHEYISLVQMQPVSLHVPTTFLSWDISKICKIAIFKNISQYCSCFYKSGIDSKRKSLLIAQSPDINVNKHIDLLLQMYKKIEIKILSQLQKLQSHS